MNFSMVGLFTNRSVMLSVVLVVGMFAVMSNAQAIPITLSTSTGDFNGLLLEGADAPRVGVVLLHGHGGNPDLAVVRQIAPV